MKQIDLVETIEHQPLGERILRAYGDVVPTVVVPVNTAHEGKSLLYDLADWLGPKGMLRCFESSRLRLALNIEGGHLMRVDVVPMSAAGAFERATRGIRPTLVLDAQGQEPDQINGVPKEVWS